MSDTLQGASLLEDGNGIYQLDRGALDMLMAHGMLRKIGTGRYALSSAADLLEDPGSAGVNHPEPLAVLAVLRAALAARPIAEAEVPAIAVRELEWVGPDLSGEYYVKGALVPYKLRSQTGNGFWLTEVGGYFPSEKAAFSAARDHYVALVRGAMTLQAQPPAGFFVATEWPDAGRSYQQVPNEHADRPEVAPLYAAPVVSLTPAAGASLQLARVPG